MAFIAAGVDIIETNTYQVSIDGFNKFLGLTEADTLSLLKKAVTIAKEAVSACGNRWELLTLILCYFQACALTKMSRMHRGLFCCFNNVHIIIWVRISVMVSFHYEHEFLNILGQNQNYEVEHWY